MLSLEEFDIHLDNYQKVMELKEITLTVFFKQFKMTYSGNQSNFMKVYQYFKQNSRHLHNVQLIFYEEICNGN